MLNMNKTVTINGNSQIDGVLAETFSATIDSNNPDNMSLSSYIQNSKTYRENQAQCDKDWGEFCTEVFKVQDEMKAE